MILSDKLSTCPAMANKTVKILAVDDTFVERHTGNNVYTDAHVSAEDILELIR